MITLKESTLKLMKKFFLKIKEFIDKGKYCKSVLFCNALPLLIYGEDIAENIKEVVGNAPNELPDGFVEKLIEFFAILYKFIPDFIKPSFAIELLSQILSGLLGWIILSLLKVSIPLFTGLAIYDLIKASTGSEEAEKTYCTQYFKFAIFCCIAYVLLQAVM